MGAVVVDSDVLIAFLDPNDVLHDRAVGRLTPWLSAPHQVVVPASVYSEILVAAIRSGTSGDIDRFVLELGAKIMDVTRSIAWQAAQLRARYRSLRLPDALAAATALDARADLLTLDAQLQKLWDDLG